MSIVIVDQAERRPSEIIIANGERVVYVNFFNGDRVLRVDLDGNIAGVGGDSVVA